ncbi:SDR family NAD(P)-dependent oxidoreductase, partial [Streptomyces sp. HB132]|uniref:SDR family NAD(P)-dependent oxidoreductase n=1 Tax=Streptomyces sp. HB132 TaxID=767388 RepID=UPI0019619082
DVLAVGTLRRGEGGPERFMASMAELWVQGVELDWRTVLDSPDTHDGARHIDLPTYAFQPERYWLDASVPRPSAAEAPHDGFWSVVEREDLEGLAQTLGLDDAHSELKRVLPALSAWHRRQSATASMESLRYRADWKPLSDSNSDRLSGTWLVVVAQDQVDGELNEAVAGALQAHGAKVVAIAAPDDAHEWAGLLAAHSDAAGVLSLLAEDERPLPDVSSVPAGFGRTLTLVQEMEAVGMAAPLWCVTRGAVSTGEADPLTSPAQAMVWGLGRVVAQELPGRWGGLVDLPSAPDADSLSRLCGVLAADAHEDQVVVRPFGVLGRRIVRAPIGDESGGGWTPGSGTVLITGGTGALGGQVARRLASQGAEHLLLVSRRGATAPGAAELEAELTEAGARVTVTACDITDADALRELLAAVPDEYPLTAVIHTAAVLDDGAVTTLTFDQVDRVLRAKAQAAWRLHELTRELELTAFVLFSSLAGTVGMAGQGNYAPANAYLDALAQYRRSQGLKATSVAWGSWAQGGMAELTAVNEVRLRHGVPLLSPESAVSALEAALEHDDTTVVIADIDWDRFTHAYTATRSSHLLDEIPEARSVLEAAGTADPTTPLPDVLARLAPQERDRQLMSTVRTHVAAVLGHESADAVGLRRQFLELGLDSVTAVELRNRLNTATGLRLPTTVVFDHPTVADLVRHLGAELFDGTEGSGTPGAAELDSLENLVAAMSDGDPSRAQIGGRLRSLLRSVSGTAQQETAAVESEELEAASNDEIFEFIEKEFGIS